MLLGLTCILAAMMVIFVVQNRRPVSVLVGGLYLGLIVIILAYILVWIKYGGATGTVDLMLCLTRGVKRWLLYLPISASALSCALLLGKSLFLASVMLLAVSLSGPRRPWVQGLLYGLGALLPALHCAALSPAGYQLYAETPFFRTHQMQLFDTVRVLYLIWLAACFAMLVCQYRKLRIAWVKKSFYYILLLVCYLDFLFVLFAVLGPIQVSDSTSVYYVHSNFLYRQNPWGCALFVLSGFFFAVSGSQALWKYLEVCRSIGRPDVSISKRLRDSNTSVRMFTHGMKNQFLVMRSILNEMQRDETLSDQQRQQVEELSALARTMLLRMEELRNVFRTNAMVLVPVERPSEIVDAALELLGSTAVPLRVERAAEKPVLADRQHLAEALCSVMTNAVDAIAAKGGPGPGDEIEERLYENRGSMVFEVRDTGEGIEKKALRRIFEPFYTSRNTKTNWGMGLTYVQQVVRGHYGEVSIESQVGQGTSLYLTIPVYTSAREEL